MCVCYSAACLRIGQCVKKRKTQMRARAHDLHDDSYPRNYPYKGKDSVEEKKLSFLRSFVFLTVNLN